MTKIIKPLFLLIAISLLKTSSLIAQEAKTDSSLSRDPKKYYLQIGLNLIGSHPTCNVQIPSIEG